MSKELDKYRDYLIISKQNSQTTLDKYIITLSSSSIGLSIIFLTTIIKNETINCKNILFLSWVFFGLSILIVLLSFLSSALAFSKALKQTDLNKIYDDPPGGFWNIFTYILNYLGILFFIAGIILLLLFIASNF